ncbi:hypothetical protein [Nitratireductor sp. GCM10026969]|uniref:hypothetical protein n=1 Tax=Nitratireductor sp. GCM10026969 TaxID=3252645 RepID=UPI00360BD8C1
MPEFKIPDTFDFEVDVEPYNGDLVGILSFVTHDSRDRYLIDREDAERLVATLNTFIEGRFRFARRQDSDGLWEVYEIANGATVITEGPLTGLDEHEAREVIDLLHEGIVEPGG